MLRLALPALALAACAHEGRPINTPPPPPAPTALFAAHLDGALASKPGNLLYSPASISIALAMTREGARDQTATEMANVLGGSSEEARALLASLRGLPAGGPEIAVANRLFVDSETPLVPAFVDVSRTAYGAPVENLDFRRAAEPSRGHINAWVAEQTHDRIKDLLPAGMIVAETRLVLVDAIYLKAAWQVALPPAATRPEPFHVAGAADRQVATMHGTVGGTWGDHGGARMLDLPYETVGAGPRFAMLLVVPDRGSLAEVEAAYDKEGFAPFFGGLGRGGEVILSLPKFEVSGDFDLGETLKTMGMPRAFTDHAEFPGISPIPVKISKVVHKAWAKIDENGTEAAAATAVGMVEITSIESDPPKPHVFPVDRSFLFFIHDERGNVLFAGRIVDPS